MKVKLRWLNFDLINRPPYVYQMRMSQAKIMITFSVDFPLSFIALILQTKSVKSKTC